MSFATDPMDRYVRARIGERPGLMVPFFLMAGHAYEHLNRSLISDGLWDELCRMLDREWDRIEHPHKGLIDRAALASGTAMDLKAEALPALVIAATARLLREGPPPGCEEIPLDWYDARSAVAVLARVLGWRLGALDMLRALPVERPEAWRRFLGTSLTDYGSLAGNGMVIRLTANPPQVLAIYQPDDVAQVLAVGDDVFHALGEARRWLESREKERAPPAVGFRPPPPPPPPPPPVRSAVSPPRPFEPPTARKEPPARREPPPAGRRDNTQLSLL